MAADSKPYQRELCDTIVRAIEIADRTGNHLVGALLMQAYEASGCGGAKGVDDTP